MHHFNIANKREIDSRAGLVDCWKNRKKYMQFICDSSDDVDAIVEVKHSCFAVNE